MKVYIEEGHGPEGTVAPQMGGWVAHLRMQDETCRTVSRTKNCMLSADGDRGIHRILSPDFARLPLSKR